MKKLIAFVLICFTILCFGCNKTKVIKAKTFDGWTTVKMNNEIEFQIPPTMEIENDKYASIGKKAEPGLYKLIHVPDGNIITAQQLGLNSMSKEAFKHYVRAIMVIIDSPEELPAFGEPLKFTNEELKELEDEFRQDFYAYAEKFKAADRQHRGFFLVGVTSPYKVVKINGVDCLHFSYTTQLGDNPFVSNDIYLFMNKKKAYKLSIMIRTTENHLWTAKGMNVLDIPQTVQLIDKNK